MQLIKLLNFTTFMRMPSSHGLRLLFFSAYRRKMDCGLGKKKEAKTKRGRFVTWMVLWG